MDAPNHNKNSAISTPDRSADLELLTAAVREAGALALGYFGKHLREMRKSDGSPVSEADLAADALLRERLTAERPDYGWLSEETEDDPARLECDRVWVVDPIDGTRAFLKNKPEWTVAAALVEAGRPVIAIVFNPVAEEFYHATLSKGAYLNDRPISASDPVQLENCSLAASGGLFRRDIWDRPWPHLQTRWVNSVAYRLALVAAGKFDGTVSLSNKHDWDLAAAELLVREAGGAVTTHTGGDFLYNSPIPLQQSVVAAGPALHEELLNRTRSARL